MFHYISNIQNNKAVPLIEYIDNRNDNVCVGIKLISYWNGLYNVQPGEYIQVYYQATIDKNYIDAGLYNFDKLQKVFTSAGAQLTVSKLNGLVTLKVPADYKIIISDGITELLGFTSFNPSAWINSGTYVGNKSIDLAPIKSLYIHLDQINTYNNLCDGSPSTLIGVITMQNNAFGENSIFEYGHPQFRKLTNGTVSELTLRVRDKHNNKIYNNNMPIDIMLEIIEK
jgi:hypothetical protein